jgi:hypothetical protein
MIKDLSQALPIKKYKSKRLMIDKTAVIKRQASYYLVLIDLYK